MSYSSYRDPFVPTKIIRYKSFSLQVNILFLEGNFMIFIFNFTIYIPTLIYIITIWTYLKVSIVDYLVASKAKNFLKVPYISYNYAQE